MSAYDSETEAAGRHDAALARAEAFQALYEVERLAEEVFAERSERAASRRAVLYRFLELSETVHLCPAGDEATTPCCHRSPFELPRDDRITLDDDLVTCCRFDEKGLT